MTTQINGRQVQFQGDDNSPVQGRFASYRLNPQWRLGLDAQQMDFNDTITHVGVVLGYWGVKR